MTRSEVRYLPFNFSQDLRQSRRQVTATTFVRTRNRLGRLYLAAVKPFHRAIVPAMLAQVGRS